MDCKHDLSLREFAMAYYFGSSKCKKCGKKLHISLTKHLYSILVGVLALITIRLVFDHFHSNLLSLFLALIIQFVILHIYIILCYKKHWYQINAVEEGTSDDDETEDPVK